jgi:hypothetical protein
MAEFGGDNLPAKRGGGGKKGRNIPDAAVPFVHELVEPRCKVCKSPYRREVDQLLATGWSQAMVIDHFNEMIEEPSLKFNAQNMSVHKRKHLTSRDSAVRRIMEARALQLKIDTDEAEGHIVTKMGVLDTIIYSGLQGLHRGDSIAEPKDIIAAISAQEKMEAEWRETALDEVMTDFQFFMEAVKEVVGEDLYTDIYDRFDQKIKAKTDKTIKPLPPAAILIAAEDVVEQEEDEDGSS